MTPITLDQERSSAWTRRALMGAAGSGLILATNSHLLPESMAAETAAVDQPLRLQGAGKQRHRRKRRYNHHKKHRHTPDTQAYATVVLPRAQVIPGNTRTTIGFDYVLTSRNFSFVSGASNVLVNHSGQYEFRIFLSLSSSSTSAWTTTLMLNRAGSPSEAFADS